MANIKSAKKRINVIEKKTLRNKMIRSKVKTVIKKVEAAIAAGDKVAAQQALVVATSEINKAASKGIYHKNNAARKVSRLAVAVADNYITLTQGFGYIKRLHIFEPIIVI